jgi:hypothetical protein
MSEDFCTSLTFASIIVWRRRQKKGVVGTSMHPAFFVDGNFMPLERWLSVSQ